MADKPKRVRGRARPYRYYVGKGNNPDLIRAIMGTRDWWEELSPEELEHTPYNFKWKQLNYRKAELESLGTVKGVRQCCNHFENNMEMCAKSGLFRNMSYFYERVLQQDVFKVIPVTFNFSSLRDPEYATFLETWQTCELVRKEDLGEPLDVSEAVGVEQLAESTAAPVASDSRSSPKAAIPPKLGKPSANPTDEAGDSEKKQTLRMNYKFSDRSVEKKNTLRNTWILKPGTGTNRGIGILVFHELAELERHINKWNNRKHSCFNWIVQKYMEQPLLIDTRKFDIRAYSLVTHNQDLYYYNEGYLRTSAVPYDLDNLEDKNIHLTNWAVQKKADNYGADEDANQMNFLQFQEYLDQHHPGINVETHFKEKMKELIMHCFAATTASLNLNNFKYCMELFGYDFMIDTDYRVTLIEVNNNPCLCTPGDTTGELIPAMLEDIMKLAIDPIFPASGDPLGRTKPKVEGTNFVLLHSSSSKATMELREKWRQNVKEQRRTEKEAENVKEQRSPDKSSPDKRSPDRLRGGPRPIRRSYSCTNGNEPKSHRSFSGPCSPQEGEGGEIEQIMEVPYEEAVPPSMSMLVPETDTACFPDSEDTVIHPDSAQQAGEKKQSGNVPVNNIGPHRRLTAVPHEQRKGFGAVNGRSSGSRQQERDPQWVRLNMQAGSQHHLKGPPKSDLSTACSFLETPNSHANDLTVSPLRHQVELLAMHRHFKSKAVESARRKRFTVGMTQPQLARRGAADSQERSGHLPGIGSPPGSHRRRGEMSSPPSSSGKSNESPSSPNWMVREAAAEAEEVARQLREAGMANEAAQLERLRVELLQPGTDLTAKKNEARLLAERLRTQARERKTGPSVGLGGSEMLIGGSVGRGPAASMSRFQLQLHIDTKADTNTIRRAVGVSNQLPAVCGTMCLSPSVVNIG